MNILCILGSHFIVAQNEDAQQENVQKWSRKTSKWIARCMRVDWAHTYNADEYKTQNANNKPFNHLWIVHKEIVESEGIFRNEKYSWCALTRCRSVEPWRACHVTLEIANDKFILSAIIKRIVNWGASVINTCFTHIDTPRYTHTQHCNKMRH